MSIVGYRVYIAPPGGHSDPLSQTVDIYVINEGFGTRTILGPDGLWVDAKEGSAPPGPSLALPVEAMEALVEAVERYKGAPSHAKTEAAVLRQWLDVERSRIDAVWERIVRER